MKKHNYKLFGGNEHIFERVKEILVTVKNSYILFNLVMQLMSGTCTPNRLFMQLFNQPMMW